MWSFLGSGAVGFAHLDGSCTEECVVNMVHRIQELSMGFPDSRLEMSLIGGFSHVLRYSEQVFYSLMGNDKRLFIEKYKNNYMIYVCRVNSCGSQTSNRNRTCSGMPR